MWSYIYKLYSVAKFIHGNCRTNETRRLARRSSEYNFNFVGVYYSQYAVLMAHNLIVHDICT